MLICKKEGQGVVSEYCRSGYYTNTLTYSCDKCFRLFLSIFSPSANLSDKIGCKLLLPILSVRRILTFVIRLSRQKQQQLYEVRPSDILRLARQECFLFRVPDFGFRVPSPAISLFSIQKKARPLLTLSCKKQSDFVPFLY